MRKNQIISSTKEIIVQSVSLLIVMRVPQKLCSTAYLHSCDLFLKLSLAVDLSQRRTIFNVKFEATYCHFCRWEKVTLLPANGLPFLSDILYYYYGRL